MLVRRSTALPRHYARAFAVALDIDALPDLQIRIRGLRHRDEHAILHAHDDLLRGHGLIVLLLNLVAGEGSSQRADDHRYVASRSGADQAADAESPEPADDRADALVMIALDLRLGDLLDHALADLHRSW